MPDPPLQRKLTHSTHTALTRAARCTWRTPRAPARINSADGYCHWQKLWFQLQHGMLLQYLTAGEADARARKRPAGIIQVDGVTAIMRVANGTMLPCKQAEPELSPVVTLQELTD